jgi:protein gp37
MGDRSSIEWTNSSCTPIRARNRTTGKVGWHCEHVTTGCEFCYAESMNKRLGTGLPFKPGHRSDIDIFLDDEMLMAPLRWRKPRMIFLCSMTDAFADFVRDEWLDKIFAVMALCPQHTFQVLTKRAERMLEYFERMQFEASGEDGAWAPRRLDAHACEISGSPCAAGYMEDVAWPLKNCWLGVSCERQQEADQRIPLLLQTPAAVRFISAEPLLGPIRLHERLGDDWLASGLSGERKGLDWVIVGGESGKHARPMHPDWARSLRDQCAGARVAFFFKQYGEFTASGYDGADSVFFSRVGKKAAGRLLDGREHSDFPGNRGKITEASSAEIVRS